MARGLELPRACANPLLDVGSRPLRPAIADGGAKRTRPVNRLVARPVVGVQTMRVQKTKKNRAGWRNLIDDLRQGGPVDGDPADGRRRAGRRSRRALSTGAGEPSDKPMTRAPLDLRQFGHELRTPLHAILGNVELLLDGTAGPLSTEARKCVGEIQTASRQLSRQVQTLLLWSELRAGDANSDGATLDLIALDPRRAGGGARCGAYDRAARCPSGGSRRSVLAANAGRGDPGTGRRRKCAGDQA